MSDVTVEQKQVLSRREAGRFLAELAEGLAEDGKVSVRLGSSTLVLSNSVMRDTPVATIAVSTTRNTAKTMPHIIVVENSFQVTPRNCAPRTPRITRRARSWICFGGGSRSRLRSSGSIATT